MASTWRIFLVTGSTVAAMAVLSPAQAEEILTQPSTMAGYAQTMSAVAESDASLEVIEAPDLEMNGHLTNSSESAIIYEGSQGAELSDEAIESTKSVDEPLDLTSVAPGAFIVDEAVSTAAATFFAATEVAETSETEADGQQVAQVTRPLFRGAPPFYIGIGGNIGIVDSDESAVGDFGFNIISKISLGPRFSVRPVGSFSEDDVSVAIPVTYNFNPFDVGDFNLYPAAGVGVDIGDDIALLVNAGLDVPISRRFTVNGQFNIRTTDDFGVGLSLGVAYNFPFFFE